MTHIDYAFEARRQALELNLELLTATLSKSKGRPMMSDEDVKMAIVALNGIVGYHFEMVRNLVVELSLVKQPWYKRIFRK